MLKIITGSLLVGVLWLGCLVAAHGEVASRRDFETIAAQLDPGGELFLVLQSGRWIDRMLENLAADPEAGMPVTDTDARAVRERLGKIRHFLGQVGVSAWRGLGVSSVSRRGPSHQVKLFVLRDSVDAKLPFWRGLLGWQPRRLMSLDFVPAGCSIVQAGTFQPTALWTLVADGARETGGLTSQLRFDTLRAAATTWLGMDPADVLGSLRDEMLVTLRFDKEKTFSLPVDWGALSLPVPDILVVVATGEDVLRGVVEAKLASLALPLTESEIAGIPMRYAESPLPGMPFPVQPALASAPGFLLLGSSPDVVESALLAYRHRNGLIARPGFQDAFRGLPMVNNGIVYIDSDAARLVQHALESHAEARHLDTPTTPSAMARVDDSLRMGDDNLPTLALVVRNLKHGVMVRGYSGVGGETLLRGMGATLLKCWNRLWQRIELPENEG